jgi:alpha-glucosidase
MIKIIISVKIQKIIFKFSFLYCYFVIKKLMKYLIYLLLLTSFISCQQKPTVKVLSSPDGKIKINIGIAEGKAFYNITADGNSIINKSVMGFDFKDLPSLGDSLEITNTTNLSRDESWKPVCGTSSEIRNHYNETSVSFTEIAGLKRSFTVVARAYNDGVAFRYEFPVQKHDSLFITAENTCFNFPDNDTAWWIPSDEFAYESLYRKTPLSQIHDANTPFTIQTKSGYFISLHEAALLDYSEYWLKKNPKDSMSFSSSLWPEPDGVCARVKLPFKTPWRCLMIGRKPGDLLESHLIQNLNEASALNDVSWIKPSKFIGIWWGMQTGEYSWKAGPNHGATTARMMQYIDFAKQHHIGAVLAEGWNKGWETWNPSVVPMQDFCTAYPDFDLKKVVEYAKDNHIEFMSHHETGGNIPEYERQIDSAFALCQRLGIKMLKTGYAGSIIPKGFHHHGQFMVRHFQRVVALAAKYHIMLDVHESIKPTGLDRSWPNLMTQEAVRGNEWNGGYKATPAYHAAILPFTRQLAGPFDYTPGIFHINHTPELNKRLYSTLTYQLAMFVVFYSPLMMVSDKIENYENKAAFKFIEDVAVSWDESHVVDAVLGKYVSIVRRSGDQWFIGSLCDENAHKINIPLSFLNKDQQYIATIYGDAINTDWEKNPEAVEIADYVVCSKDTIYAALSKAGGHCVSIRPAASADLKNKAALKLYNSKAEAKIQAFNKLKTYGDERISHLALNKPLTLLTAYSDRYPASGKNALTDGRRGLVNYSLGNWQGYEGVNMDACIDLGKMTGIHQISCGFLSNPDSWIFLPLQLDFYTSADGINFDHIGKLSNTMENASAMNIIRIKNFTLDFAPLNVRYVRVKTTTIIHCPAWHYGKGGKAWLFCDEIVVN